MIFYRYIILLGLLLTLGSVYQVRGNSIIAIGDTLLPASISYQGYRIHIRKIDVVKQKGDEYLLRFEAVNTGRRPIQFGPGFPAHFLQTVFDKSLIQGGLGPLAEPLRSSLSKSLLSIKVGEWLQDLEFWVTPGEGSLVKLKTDDYDWKETVITRRLPSANPSSANEEKKLSLEDCKDLMLEDVSVVFQGKGFATMQLSLINAGNTPLKYSDLPEGISISFFLGGSSELSASSLSIGSLNLTERLGKQNELALEPGKKTLLVQKVDTKAATRYTAVVIAQVDPGQQLLECDETNNQGSALLKL